LVKSATNFDQYEYEFYLSQKSLTELEKIIDSLDEKRHEVDLREINMSNSLGRDLEENEMNFSVDEKIKIAIAVFREKAMKIINIY
jgi:hypothetical protein